MKRAIRWGWPLVPGLAFIVLLAVALGAPSVPHPSRSTLAPGELHFAPDAPVSGDRIHVTYSPVATLAGEPELVLRGHFRTPVDARYNGRLRNERVAALERHSGGTFTAGFTLPDSAVYAAFIVEDMAGQRLDADGGRLFELLVHAGDGKPLYHALIQRAYDFAGRNWITAYESNRRAMELYPDSLAGWSELRFHENVALGSSGADTLLARHRENFAAIHGRHAEQGLLPLETIVAIERYARGVADSATPAFWTQRSNEAAPTSPEQSRAFSMYREWLEHRDEAVVLAGLDELWPEARGKGTQVAEFGLWNAVEVKDLAAVDLWTERILSEGRRGELYVARIISALPERRELYERLTREQYGKLVVEQMSTPVPDLGELVGNHGRPLGRTVTEYVRTLRRLRAEALSSYGEILRGVGDEATALAAIEEAAAGSVNPQLFRSLGDLKLELGDTEGAARDYAVAATDPSTSEAESDSLAALAGLSPDSPEWVRLLDAAVDRIMPEVLGDTVRWTPQSTHVSDADENRWSLSQLMHGRPAVLVFWARSCGPCIEEIPEVVRLRERLEPEGIEVLSITVDDLPGPGMDDFIRNRGVSYPVYYDLAREASNAFGISAIPANFVLDVTGTVRFAFSEIAEVPLQVEALRRLNEAAR